LSVANLNPVQLSFLQTSLDARASDLDRRIFSLDDLDSYAQVALVPILASIQMIHDENYNDSTEQGISHLGKAQLLVRRLRGLAKALSLRSASAEQFIPIGLLGTFGLNGSSLINAYSSPTDPSSSKLKEKLAKLVQEMALHSNFHLSGGLECKSRFCKLTHYTISRYLDNLKKHNFDILNPKVIATGSVHDGLLPLKLLFK
jgi:hypothetical protein